MLIAYLGNFVPPASTENEVAKALEAIDVDVRRIQEGTPCEDVIDAVALNGALPDVFLWTRTGDLAAKMGTHEQQLEMLAALTDLGVPSVGYHLDRWWGLDREGQVHSEPFFRCDVVCTADGGHDAHWRSANVNHRWFPPAISEFETTPGRWREGYAGDVVFCGSWRYVFDDDGNQVAGYHAEWTHRRELIEWLRSNYGTRQLRLWPRGARITGRALADVYASSKVIIGDSCLVGNATHYWSDRIPETLGRRAFLLHPHVDGLADHFVDGEHLVTWQLGEWEQLRELINRYLVDDTERERIAAAGHEHVIANHTYTVRMRQLLSMLHDEGML